MSITKSFPTPTLVIKILFKLKFIVTIFKHTSEVVPISLVGASGLLNDFL